MEEPKKINLDPINKQSKHWKGTIWIEGKWLVKLRCQTKWSFKKFVNTVEQEIIELLELETYNLNNFK